MSYRYSRAGRSYMPRTQRRLTYRRNYRSNYAKTNIPSDYGGIRGAPMDKTGRGFRGTYTRSNVEKKFIDTAQASYDCDTTGSVTCLNLCDEGTGISQRIGRKICIKSVQVRGIVRPVDATSSDNTTRIMLIWDKQVNGVIATISEILSAATAHSFMNLDNRERFVVLMDKQFAVGRRSDASGNSGSPNVYAVNKYKKMPAGSITIYDGTGAGIADVNTGALYLVTIGSQAAAAGSVFSAACRVRYTDS